jgi:hypothetical protein
MRSADCKPLEEERDVSSANRPAYQFNFETAKPCSIDKYQWDKFGIAGAHHSMGGLGSLGVFLLDLKDGGGVIVMKQGSIQSAAELYCSLLYRDLGIAAPAMRVLHSGEYGQIITQLGECSFTSPGAGDHLQSRSGMSGVTGQRGALLMEFSPGVTFKHPSVKAMLEDPGKAQSLLTQFGNLIAVDMLVNNFDRSPAIWTHEGNANNILIEVVGDSVVVHGIDQGCTPIVNEQYGDDRIGVYTKSVTEMIQECADGNTDGPKTGKISQFLSTWCGVDIGPTGRKHVQDGIVESCIKIAMYEGFQKQQSRAQSVFTDANWGTPGLTSINVGFLEAVAEAIADAVSQVK